MWELEITERATLFNVFDADRNGTLSVTEIVQGLLMARGDAKRSDVLAGVLGVRALQETMHKFKRQHTSSQHMLSEKLDLVAAQQNLQSQQLANVQLNESLFAESDPVNEFDDSVVDCGSRMDSRIEEERGEDVQSEDFGFFVAESAPSGPCQGEAILI